MELVTLRFARSTASLEKLVNQAVDKIFHKLDPVVDRPSRSKICRVNGRTCAVVKLTLLPQNDQD